MKKLLFGGTFTLSGLFLFKKYYIEGTPCHITKDMTGKIVVITDSNTGVGKEAVRELSKRNATVIFASVDPEVTLSVIKEIQAETQNPNLEFIHLNLIDLRSIKKFAEDFKARHAKLDVLINNAMVGPPERWETVDGFEAQFGVNHLGHFYLTNLLLDTIKASSPSRIINISSKTHLQGKMNWNDLMSNEKYSAIDAFAQSKLANVIFTKELQKRLDKEQANVKVVSLHPGVIQPNGFEDFQGNALARIGLNLATPFISFFTKTPKQGAQTILYCALEDHNALVGGGYYDDSKVAKVNPIALEKEAGEKLWDLSNKFVNK